MIINCGKSCILKDIFNDNERLEKHCQEIAQKKHIKMLEKLRPMELKLLPYFGMGYLNKEIAEKFNVSESTIKSHKASAVRNLGLKNSAGLICFISKCGIV